jgi:hypothetical protein
MPAKHFAPESARRGFNVNITVMKRDRLPELACAFFSRILFSSGGLHKNIFEVEKLNLHKNCI